MLNPHELHKSMRMGLPGARIQGNANQSVAHITNVIYQFGVHGVTIPFDPFDMYTAASHALTIRRGGIYHVCGSINWLQLNGSTGMVATGILLNGATVVWQDTVALDAAVAGNAPARPKASCSTIIKCDVGDLLTLNSFHYNTAAAARSIRSAGVHSPVLAAQMICGYPA